MYCTFVSTCRNDINFWKYLLERNTFHMCILQLFFMIHVMITITKQKEWVFFFDKGSKAPNLLHAMVAIDTVTL